MLKNDYKKAIDAQHASEELICKTLSRIQSQMQADQKPTANAARKHANGIRSVSEEQSINEKPSAFTHRPKKTLYRWAAIAACFVLLLTAWGIYALQGDQITYSKVTASNSIEGSLTFTQFSQAPIDILSGLKRVQLPGEAFLPEGLLASTPARINGYLVYFGIEEDSGTLYAAFQNADTWDVLCSSMQSQDEFSDAVRSFIDRLN